MGDSVPTQGSGSFRRLGTLARVLLETRNAWNIAAMRTAEDSLHVFAALSEKSRVGRPFAQMARAQAVVLGKGTDLYGAATHRLLG